MSSDSKLPRGLTPHHSAASWRWVPTPARRAEGWRSTTLRNPDGGHMTMGQAVDAAAAINAVTDAWEAGQDVTGWPWAHLNPETATRQRAPVSGPARDAIGPLIDAYLASEPFQDLAPLTQRNIKGQLGQLVDTLAGFKNGPPKPGAMTGDRHARECQRYAAAVAIIRAMPVADLVPQKPKKGEQPVRLLETAYYNLARRINPRTGKPTIAAASAVLRAASGWLSWVRHKQNLIERNPVADIDIALPEGRIVIWPQHRIDQVLTAARASGWHSVAFAVELALELSWNQADVLAIREDDIRDGRLNSVRGKTKIRTETTLTRRGLDLITRIRAHNAKADGDKVARLPGGHLLRVDRRPGHHDHGAVGGAWDIVYFRAIFTDIRDAVFAGSNEALNYTFQDFRDTAITQMYDAGLDFVEIASRTRHSLQHVMNVISKHYGKITRTVADRAAAKLDTFHLAKGLFNGGEV